MNADRIEILEQRLAKLEAQIADIATKKQLYSLEDVVGVFTGRLFVVECQLEDYALVRDAAFSAYTKTHPEACADFRRIDDLITPPPKSPPTSS